MVDTFPWMFLVCVDVDTTKTHSLLLFYFIRELPRVISSCFHVAPALSKDARIVRQRANVPAGLWSHAGETGCVCVCGVGGG